MTNEFQFLKQQKYIIRLVPQKNIVQQSNSTLAPVPNARLERLRSGNRHAGKGARDRGSGRIGALRALATDDTNLPQVSVRVLQNPTSDVLRLQLNTVVAGNYTLQLFDLAGKSCLTQTQKLETGENNLQLPLENLSSGIYLLSLQANGRIVHTEKIIVQ